MSRVEGTPDDELYEDVVEDDPVELSVEGWLEAATPSPEPDGVLEDDDTGQVESEESEGWTSADEDEPRADSSSE